MHCSIFNREFQHPADGWYQIEALGQHPNRAAGVIQVIDQAAAESIVATFNREAESGKLRHGQEMLIDHEHFSDQADQESRAYGWLQRLCNRADGIYGQLRWTTTGKAAVDGGDYRFFSTEYAPQDLRVLNSGAGEPQRVRPMRLDGLSLTNMNNNRGQRPITNRRGEDSSPTTAVIGGSPKTAAISASAAAQRIAVLAGEEQARHGGSLASCYNRVMNREPRLRDVALGSQGSQGSQGNLSVPLEGLADWAARRLLDEAATTGFSLSAGLRVVQNRLPALSRIANRALSESDVADIDALLRKLQVKAYSFFARALAAPEQDRLPTTRWAGLFQMLSKDLRAQDPNADTTDPDVLWEFFKAANPEGFYKFCLGFEGDGPFLWDSDTDAKRRAFSGRNQ